MINVAKLLYVLRAYRAGMPLGDVVVLKLDALRAAPEGVAEKLAAVRGYSPEQDLATLRQLPAGSLGREYASFLDANGITPLAVSAAVRERFRDDPYALRYTTTHDIHHVLAGFDTGLAGEIGVLAFNIGQGIAPVSRGMLWLARLISMLVSPMQARAIANNARVGLAMGERAELVIGAPIESYFGEPLGEVRRKLGIADPRDAGVMASGRSVVVRLMEPAGSGRR